MAIPRSLKNATVTLYDTDGSNSTTLTLEDGDISISGIGFANEHYADRGGPGVLIESAFTPLTFSMTVAWTTWAGVSVGTIVNGTATSWDFSIGASTIDSVDVSGATNRLQDKAAGIPLFQIKIVVADPDGVGSETFWLLDCSAVINATEGMPNKFAISGTSYMDAAGFNALAG